MPRTLGLDVGDRRIGVAVSDPTRLLARPLCVIDRKVQEAIGAILELVRAHDVDEIVVGLPLHADGRRSEQSERVAAFAESLRSATPTPIRYHDERHSTQAAREIIAAKKSRRQDQHDDAVAAAVILQRHLDDLRPLAGGFDDADDDA
jgi:putative Holliday junction resolvase